MNIILLFFTIFLILHISILLYYRFTKISIYNLLEIKYYLLYRYILFQVNINSHHNLMNLHKSTILKNTLHAARNFTLYLAHKSGEIQRRAFLSTPERRNENNYKFK